jgi:hypothetical protein
VSPDISEFSYGFALTCELIAIANPPLRAAPILPSLIAEGRKGGGYDVNLDIPGFPLFIQFKRSEHMKTRNAKESKPPAGFDLPYYRMKITERWRSAQHDMLLELEGGGNEVFYASPLFHTVEELNAAYLGGTVSSQSRYVRPSEIGKLDDESHCVAFNAKRIFVCSEPREIHGVEGANFSHLLDERLRRDDRRIRDQPLDEMLTFVERIIERRHIRPAFRSRPEDGGLDHRLQQLADIAVQCFGAQLFVVQRGVD